MQIPLFVGLIGMDRNERFLKCRFAVSVFSGVRARNDDNDVRRRLFNYFKLFSDVRVKTKIH